MLRDILFAKVQKIFRDVFDDEALIITDTTNSADIDDWDSLNHISLVVAIEKEIDIKFSLDELASFTNVGAMVDLMIKKKQQ
jgi:acyl carrier protein